MLATQYHAGQQHHQPPGVRSQTPVIEVRGLTKVYGERRAVDSVSLTVYEGDIYGLLGPNGAGKTTLIAMLLGLVRPDAGERRICGHDVGNEQAAALRHVGAMIEAPAFYPYLSGAENLRVLGGVRSPVSAARIAAVLEQVGLAGRGRDRYRTYSLGMKQRLAVGLTLLHDPDILLLDEPTNGIDPRGMVEMRNLLRTLAAAGKTIVLCSHLLAEVEQVCMRVAVLRHGQLVAEDTLQSLAARSGLELAFLELTKEVQ